MIQIGQLPYKGLTKLTDLVVLDRSILSLFTNKKNQYFFLYLINTEIEYDEYLLWKSTPYELYSFIDKVMSLKDIILSSTKDFLYLLQSDYDAIESLDDKEYYNSVFSLEIVDLSLDLLPKNESYYTFPVPESLVGILAKIAENNYVELLRNHAIYFKIEPRSSIYSTTVSSVDVTGFLSKLTKSFLGFAAYNFSQKFVNLFVDIDRFNNTLQQVKSVLTPRVADLDYGSFEIALSIDNLHLLLEGDVDVYDWQLTLIEQFRDEIINADFLSISASNSIIEKYPIEVRREIFSPLFQIADSTSYTVKFSNRKRIYTDSLDPVDRETKKRIVMVDKDKIESEDDKLELMTFVVAVPEGSKMSDLNKRTMNRNVLSVSKSDTQEIKYEDSFNMKGRAFTITSPLTLRIATRGQIIILLCDVFSIEVNSTDNVELYSNLQNEIYNYYLTKVANNATSNEAKTFYLYFKISNL